MSEVNNLSNANNDTVEVSADLIMQVLQCQDSLIRTQIEIIAKFMEICNPEEGTRAEIPRLMLQASETLAQMHSLHKQAKGQEVQAKSPIILPH
jgi:hypothetical protein